MGSGALSEGESIYVVAGFLGHSDPGFTLRAYAPFMPNQARDTADRLSSKLAALLEGQIGKNIARLEDSSTLVKHIRS